MTDEETITYLLTMTKRKGIKKLIKYMKLNGFFTAPASSGHHLAITGGLAQHSRSVYNTLINLHDMYWYPTHKHEERIPTVTLTLVSLLHDICKMNLYIWSESQKKYIYDDKFPVGHGEKSVIILQRFIKLTDQEIAMIRWHMTVYDPAYSRNEKDIAKQYPEAKLLYFADDISTHYCEG